MDSDGERGEPRRARERAVLIGLAAAIVAGGFLFDLAMPLGVAASMVYALLVLLSLRVADTRATWLAALLATALTGVGLLIDLGEAHFEHWKGYLNRATAVFTFWAMALLAVAYKRSRERLRLEQTVGLRAEQLASLGEMTGGIAHELGTPLAALQGRLELLDQDLAEGRSDPEALRKAVQLASALGDRMALIIRAVRSLARDASADPFVEVPVGRIVRDALAVAEERLVRLGIEVRVEPFDPELRVSCRETQIGQVLLNLVANAADAVQDLPERWLRIAVAREPEGVAISVTDSGSGIPERLRATIMQPFFTTKPAGRGTGLGLSVSRTFVESHGGTLTVDAASPHTRLVVWLPVRR